MELPENRREERYWPEYQLSWNEGELRWEATFQENAEARAVLEHVPAGKLVLRFRGEGAGFDNQRSWPVLAEIELAPGEQKFVVLE